MDANHLSHKTFNGNLFIISAPSGTGKTSLVKALLKKMSNITMSTSHTTRPARKGEVDGKDYYFTKKDDFECMIKAYNWYSLYTYSVILNILPFLGLSLPNYVVKCIQIDYITNN